ncbi:MAG: hypothetical protein HPY60_03890 [Candidatus Methanofastidiosum sp.]|nr:hypothetical protein [Methanofastidiosum sp.]
MTLDNNLIVVFLLLSLVELLTFFSILNSLRYRKYGKLIRIDANIPETHYTGNGVLAYLILIFMFVNLFAIFLLKFWGFVFSVLWITFSSIFLYWYWHTKEDPLNRFHYEQKVWEDPRDKKKKETN